MSQTDVWDATDEGEGDEPLMLRRRLREECELDMTPMIDCTFLLLIFFLVGSTPDLATSVELPPARHGTAVDPSTAVILTLAYREGDKPALVYVADGKVGDPLPDDLPAQEAAIVLALEEAHRQGKMVVLVKGERTVRHRDVSRIASAVSQVQGMKLELAVFEIE